MTKYEIFAQTDDGYVPVALTESDQLRLNALFTLQSPLEYETFELVCNEVMLSIGGVNALLVDAYEENGLPRKAEDQKDVTFTVAPEGWQAAFDAYEESDEESDEENEEHSNDDVLEVWYTGMTFQNVNMSSGFACGD